MSRRIAHRSRIVNAAAFVTLAIPPALAAIAGAWTDDATPTTSVPDVARAQPGAQETSWLDRPLEQWNREPDVPAPPAGTESAADLRKRCAIPPPDTDAHRAVERAGWIAYDHLDRRLAQGTLEVAAGMRGADPECRPTAFNIFVFVGGRYAGSIAPGPMTTGLDASAGAVRITGPDRMTAEFARYGNADAPCCPTARMTVEYRIESAGHPRLVPVNVRTTRQHPR
jgi:hypothetical protein